MLLVNLLDQFLRSMKKIMKKHFNENLIMSEGGEQQFQSSNTCWICEKLIDNDAEKVRSLSRNWQI